MPQGDRDKVKRCSACRRSHAQCANRRKGCRPEQCGTAYTYSPHITCLISYFLAHSLSNFGQIVQIPWLKPLSGAAEVIGRHRSEWAVSFAALFSFLLLCYFSIISFSCSFICILSHILGDRHGETFRVLKIHPSQTRWTTSWTKRRPSCSAVH